MNAIFEFGNPPDYDKFYKDFTEVMNLEINKDNIPDPKRTYKIQEVLDNFLLPEEKSLIYKQYRRTTASLKKQILDHQDSQGYTPLHLSSFYGQYELVNKFLLLKANTKLRDLVHHKEAIEYSRNPCIMKAIRDINDSVLDNDMEKFNFLLNSGFGIEDKKSIKIRRPMHHAIINADQEIQKELVKSGVDPHSKQRHEVSLGTGSGNEELFLKTVVKCGADIDSTDSDGWTALHYACKLGNSDPVITLLNNGAKHDIFSNHGYYPLHIAAIEDHVNVIRILVERGAEIAVGLG